MQPAGVDRIEGRVRREGEVGVLSAGSPRGSTRSCEIEEGRLERGIEKGVGVGEEG